MIKALVSALLLGLIAANSASAHGTPEEHFGAAGQERLLVEGGGFGPYRARVLDVLEAHVLRLEVELWPDQSLVVNVSAHEADAPSFTRPRCDEERLLSTEFRQAISRRYGGQRVYVTGVVADNAGIVGDIFRLEGGEFKSLSAELIERGMAVPLRPDMPQDWCTGD